MGRGWPFRTRWQNAHPWDLFEETRPNPKGALDDTRRFSETCPFMAHHPCFNLPLGNPGAMNFAFKSVALPRVGALGTAKSSTITKKAWNVVGVGDPPARSHAW